MPKANWGQVCQDAKKLIKGMLDPSPAKRLTLEAALQSPFLCGQASTTPLQGLPGRLEMVGLIFSYCYMHVGVTQVL